MVTLINDFDLTWLDYKSQIVHCKKRNSSLTEYEFTICGVKLKKIQHYKYLVVILDEQLSFEPCITVLGRALGGIINKFRSLKT